MVQAFALIVVDHRYEISEHRNTYVSQKSSVIIDFFSFGTMIGVDEAKMERYTSMPCSFLFSRYLKISNLM